MFDRKNQKLYQKIKMESLPFYKSNSQPVNELANGYFGFKTLTTPPPNKHLNAFENDLYDLIQKVEFTNVPNTFQQKLKKDVQRIKSSNNMLVLLRIKAQIFKNYHKTTMKSY